MTDVLVPLVADVRHSWLMEAAIGLGGDDGELTFVSLVEESADAAGPHLDVDRDLARTVFAARDVAPEAKTVDGYVQDAPSVAEGVVLAVESYDPDYVVFPYGGADQPETARTVHEETDATVLVVAEETTSPTVESVLAAVGGGPHSGAVVDVAAGLARASDAALTLCHVVASDADASTREAAEDLLGRAADRVGDDVPVETVLVEDDDVADGIADTAGPHDVSVVGGPEGNGLLRLLFGTTSERLRTRSGGPTVTVWGGDEEVL